MRDIVVSLQAFSFDVEPSRAGLGRRAFLRSAAVLAVVREAGPIATALLIAGAGGSAIAADLGARKIREELDAMMVLGIDPIQRLVVPRVLACMLVAFFLNGMVSVVGVTGGYVFNVILQDGTPGAYLASFTALAQLPDLWIGLIKALIFGLIAAIVAGMRTCAVVLVSSAEATRVLSSPRSWA